MSASVTWWTAALQAPLSMVILQARILEWVASPEDLPNPGIEPSFLMRCRWILYLLSHQRKSDSEPISVQMSSLQVARSGTTLKFQSVLLFSSFALHWKRERERKKQDIHMCNYDLLCGCHLNWNVSSVRTGISVVYCYTPKSYNCSCHREALVDIC